MSWMDVRQTWCTRTLPDRILYDLELIIMKFNILATDGAAELKILNGNEWYEKGADVFIHSSLHLSP